jgi:hypothetical protein
LCCEWIAGRLAQKAGLPIPPFAALIVPEEFIGSSPMPEIHDLGQGPVFGSQDVSPVQELNWVDINKVEVQLRRRILLFDWWVQNSDRTLGIRGGNPNMLWEAGKKKPWIIDHNLAFDESFDLKSFFSAHVFSHDIKDAPAGDLLAIRDTMRSLLVDVEQIYLEIPEQWRYFDAEFSDPISFSLETVQSIISRLETDFEKDWIRLP